MKLQGVEAERPLTHDLLATILPDLDVSVVPHRRLGPR